MGIARAPIAVEWAGAGASAAHALTHAGASLALRPMNPKSVKEESVVPSEAGEAAELPLGLGWSLGVDRRPRGVSLRLVHPNQQPVLVEITVTTRGPVIRASAVALEIDAADAITATCERFSIEARDVVSVRAREIVHHATGRMHAEGGDIDLIARDGDVRMRANDDVQLLGEHVLLNCEREQPLPAWLPTGSCEVTLPRQDEGGALDLIETSAAVADTK